MRSLRQHVESKGPFSVRDALGWVLRMGLSVSMYHAGGFFHGCLGPDSIQIAGTSCREDGVLSAPELDPSALASQPMGLEAGVRADIKALGVILYWVLTGKEPFTSEPLTRAEGERQRPARPLALWDPDLDALQPLMDRLIGPDESMLMGTASEVVMALSQYSPVIADLPPLRLAQVPSHQRTAAASPSRAARWVGPLVLAAGLGGVAMVGLALRPQSGSELTPGERQSRRPAAGRTHSSVSPQAGVSGRLAEHAARKGAPLPDVDALSPSATAAAASSVSPPAGAAVSVASPGARSQSPSVVSCLAPFFASQALLEPSEPAAFDCEEQRAAKAVLTMTRGLIAAHAGAATPVTRTWATLGWYQLAVVAVARASCCEGAAPLVSVEVLGVCGLADALNGLASAAEGREAELTAALTKFREAVACAQVAGAGGRFGQRTAPAPQQAARFVRMISRYRETLR